MRCDPILFPTNFFPTMKSLIEPRFKFCKIYVVSKFKNVIQSIIVILVNLDSDNDIRNRNRIEIGINNSDIRKSIIKNEF